MAARRLSDVELVKKQIGDGLDEALHRTLSTDHFFVSSDERLTYLLELVRDQTDLVKYLKGNVRWLEGELRKKTAGGGDSQ